MKTKIKHLLGAGLSLLVTLEVTHSAAAQTSDRIVFDMPVTVEVTSQKGKPSYTTEWWVSSMNPDGSDVVQLARGRSPEWSPEQQYIAFGGLGGLAVMEASGVANGGRAFTVATDVQSTGWDWSPDGTRICFSKSSSQGLWIVDVNPITEVVGTPIQVAPGACNYPSWSPDGTKIAYTFTPEPLHVSKRYMVVLDLETSEQTAFDHMVYSAHPAWSPDGSLIAFDALVTETTTKGRKTTTNNYVEVFIANPDGTGAMQVTNFKCTTAGASWSPDGGSLAFMSDIEGMRSIYRYDLSTGVAIFLHDGQGQDWNP